MYVPDRPSDSSTLPLATSLLPNLSLTPRHLLFSLTTLCHAWNKSQKEFTDNRDKIETYLAMGASRFEGASLIPLLLFLSSFPRLPSRNADERSRVGAVISSSPIACKPVARDALKLALLPTVNQMSVIGLISIPGAYLPSSSPFPSSSLLSPLSLADWRASFDSQSGRTDDGSRSWRKLGRSGGETAEYVHPSFIFVAHFPWTDRVRELTPFLAFFSPI